MRTAALLVTLVSLFSCAIYAQDGTRLDHFNFTSFANNKPVITAELDSLTPNQFKSHPEYGIKPAHAPCKDCIELLQKRDETHRYFVKNGTKGKEFYQESSYNNENYYDENGALRSIDPRMKPADEKGVFKAIHQSMPVTINIPQRFTSILNAGIELQMNRGVTIYIQHKNGSVSSLGKPSWKHYTAGDDGVVVHNFYPGIDLEMHTQEGAIKTNYRINKPLKLRDGWLVVHDNVSLPKGFVYDYSYSDKKSRNDRDPSYGGDGDSYEGMLSINNEAGVRYFLISSPAAFDENKETNNAITLRYNTNADGSYDMYVPIDWMNSAQRSYPLVIDPFVTATSIYAIGNIKGSGYNAACFAGGCTYNLNVAVPPHCFITNVSYSFDYQALGTCNIIQGAFDLKYGACRSPVPAAKWHTCLISLPGICQSDSITCFKDVQACIQPPQCAGYNMPFILTFYRCVQPGAGCGPSCVIANTPWTMYVTGRTVEVTTADATVCHASCVNVAAHATWGVPPYTYTWNPGGIVDSIPCLKPNSSTNYTVTVTTCGGADSAQAVSHVTVTPNPNPGFTISSNPVCQNSPLTVTGLGAGAATNYSWLLPGSNLGSQNDAQVVNGVIYATAGNYDVILNYTNGTCSFPDTQQITVTPSVVPSVTIASNPNGAICTGTNVTFNATVTNGGGNPTYQWYINGNPVGGATTNPFSSTTLNNGDVITVHIISNAVCPVPDSAVSNAIKMVVTTNAVPSVTIVANPAVACPGTNVTFTATPNNQGTIPSYQWYVNGNPVGTNSLTFSSAGLNNGDNVTVHLLNSNVPCALPDSAVSNTITIVITPFIAPTVSIAANPIGAICPGTNVIFTATPTNGGASLGYQWYLNGNPVGTNNVTYASSTLVAGDSITVRLLNAIGSCISPDTAVSNTITIIIGPPIIPTVSIAANPAGAICPGTNVTFTSTITNGGASPGYQWYLNGNPVGANNATFSSSTLVAGDTIMLHLLNATDPCISPDSAVSNTITIFISPLVAPTVSIVAVPSTPICPGTNVTFTATITNGEQVPATNGI